MSQPTAKFETLLSPRRLIFRVLAAIFLTELVVMFVVLKISVPGVIRIKRLANLFSNGPRFDGWNLYGVHGPLVDPRSSVFINDL